MSRETVVMAADHAGYELKDLLKSEIDELGYDVLDLGTHGPESVDYPDFGHAAGQAISDGRASKGVIVCGSGIGISIAANRHQGVRAALCHDALTARLSRQHNDANVLALGARVVGTEAALEVVRAFLSTEFEGGRHQRRVAKLK
jgi:ribose 5-phosphate isomerase B